MSATTLHLKEEHEKILKAILRQFPYQFYAFGSRVKGTDKPFSDLDLCYKEPIPLSEIVKLETLLEESDLPFKVDIVNFQNCNQSFQVRIQSHIVPLYLDSQSNSSSQPAENPT